MVKRILCVLIGTIAFSLAAFAQTESQHLEFEGFDAVVIEDEFDVTFRESRNYMVDYTVDAALENNRLVEIYARGNTLYISLNRKGMSSDLKKQYRGRNAGKAVLKAVIYAPSISSLTVRGKAVFDAAHGPYRIRQCESQRYYHQYRRAYSRLEQSGGGRRKGRCGRHHCTQ